MAELIDSNVFGDADELAGNLGSARGTIGMEVRDHKGQLLTKWEIWEEDRDGQAVRYVVIK